MKFTIIATSDVHGHAERFSQLAQQIAAEQPDILLDLGDLLQGSHLSYYCEEVNKQPHPLISMANELSYDAAIFGNHEFNYSTEDIGAMRSACHFPWLACNVGDFAQPYIMKEVNGLHIAIIGVVTHFVPQWDEWYSTADIPFTDAFTTANETVQFVRAHEQPDFVILCYHGGFERDPKSGLPFCVEDGENQGYKMLKEIEGVDVLLTGHQHLELALTVDNTTIAQPGANAQCYAKIDVTYENDVFHHQAQLMRVDETLPKKDFPAFTAWANTNVTTLLDNYTYEHFLAPRLQSHPFTALIHQMQMAATNAQLSVVELPYHRSGGFSGRITHYDVLHNFPRKNYLQVIQLTGAEVKEALELCAAVFALNTAGEIDFSSAVYYPEPHPYIYDVWGGIDYEFAIAQPVGQRVTKLHYNGQAIRANDVFEVAISSYRATGSHGFTMMKKLAVCEVRIDIPKLMMDYLKTKPLLKQSNDFRVIIGKKAEAMRD
ncbi:MAG: bifunctional UDP-sugar hydrolase/5'-nucleotidase [Solibacillus sp.]